jgi:hypothetical protein
VRYKKVSDWDRDKEKGNLRGRYIWREREKRRKKKVKEILIEKKN